MYDSQKNGFISLCVKGRYFPEDIDDFIDEWHEGGSEETLHEFLGMSWEEYALWVSKPHVLPYIVKARMENRNVEDILSEACDGMNTRGEVALMTDGEKSVA